MSSAFSTIPGDTLGRKRMRYWHIVALPTIWVVVMVSLWVAVWPEGAMAAVVAGMPGHFLPALLGLEGIGMIWAQLLGGVIVMVAVGSLQDYLRVPPKWAWAYLAGGIMGVLLWLAGMGRLLANVLYWGCIGLYAISVLLCCISLIGLAYRTIRRNRTTIEGAA